MGEKFKKWVSKILDIQIYHLKNEYQNITEFKLSHAPTQRFIVKNGYKYDPYAFKDKEYKEILKKESYKKFALEMFKEFYEKGLIIEAECQSIDGYTIQGLIELDIEVIDKPHRRP